MEVSWLLVDWSAAESLRDNGTFDKEFAGPTKWDIWVFEPNTIISSYSGIQFQNAMAVYEDALAKLQPTNKATIQLSLGNVLGASIPKDLKIKHDEIYATYSPQRAKEMTLAFDALDDHVIQELFENSKAAQINKDAFANGSEFCQYMRQWHRIAQEATNEGRGILACVS